MSDVVKDGGLKKGETCAKVRKKMVEEEAGKESRMLEERERKEEIPAKLWKMTATFG